MSTLNEKRLKLNIQNLNQIRLSHARWAGGLGLGTVFIPLADMVVMGTNWTSLLIQIAEETGHSIDKKCAKKFAASLIKGTLFYMAGSRLGTWLVSLTGVGAPGAMAANAALNYGYTWLLGGYLIEQFRHPDVDLAELGASAAAYLLSFGLTEIAHIQDLQDAGTTIADAQAATTDVSHHAGDVFNQQPAIHNVSSASDVKFGIEGRFDVPDAVTTSGHAVGSDASGHKFDKQTGAPVS